MGTIADFKPQLSDDIKKIKKYISGCSLDKFINNLKKCINSNNDICEPINEFDSNDVATTINKK